MKATISLNSIANKKYLFFIAFTLFAIIIPVNLVGQERSELPPGLDGIFPDADNIDYSEINRFVTRLSNTSVNLDELIYWTSAQGEFYIHLEVNFYEWQGGVDKPLPKYTFSKLYQQTIEDKNSVHRLVQNKLTSLLALDKITNVGIKVKIIKQNKQQDAINNVLEGYINTAINSTIATKLLNDLLETQKKNDDEYLLFDSDFDIPLNSVEFSRKANSRDSLRLIYNNSPIYIPIKKKVDDNLLKPSVVRAAFNALSNLSGVITGETFNTREIPFEGIIKLHFTTDDNVNVPVPIKKGIDDLVYSLSYRSAENNKFTQAVDALSSSINTYRLTDENNYRLTYGARELINLAKSYDIFLREKASLDTSLAKFQDFHNEFRRFTQNLKYSGETYGFAAYGIGNIYGGDDLAIIYVPIGLDERTIRIFLQWQITIHKYLEDQMYHEKYKLAYRLN
ncbi:hypothetical protein GGR28_003776 [Lewinella aquimaris]|uniref:Uncharacterized protein n=1 Tax=Neolewinella aquimaris TaxID=1835722 RepID=A0A840EH40_9BACT|nr:hypothetical protein [Neolewinella aquimaris]MBB4081129.1 hypothetical protein [Neolewinella aquimaris]